MWVVMETQHTLLMTDLVDSTALNARLGDAAMAELWKLHDRGSRELARRFGGREVDRSDGFLMLFERCRDAAFFANEYHRMLALLPHAPAARAALHVGALTLHTSSAEDLAMGARPFDVMGIAKAVAARLMALARGGQTLASAEVAERLQGEPALRLVFHGHWRMKGVPDPVAVHEVTDGERTPLPPPPDSDKALRVALRRGQWVASTELPHRLPAERDGFHGRARELQALATGLDEGRRLLTVMGTAGVGKTRLAVRYAWSWLGRWEGGVWFCDLSAARPEEGVEGVVAAVARALDVPLGRAPVDDLARAIAGRGSCLVILDNFEQVAAHAAATLGRWLDAAPAARFLVTSRERLQLPGEWTLPLEPLATAEGVAVFRDRARQVQPGFDADPQTLDQLVTLLDGLPLAVELAAARVRTMPPAQQLAHIGQRFRLLAATQGRPDRQATLRAALDWSWELLQPAERDTLAQLSAFEGSFAPEAADAVVLPPAGDDAPWLPDLLQSLVDKSLLRALPGGRFDLLRSVQAYAGLRLGDAAPAVWQRHWRHYAGLAALPAADVDDGIAACRRATESGDGDAAVRCLLLAWTCLRMTGPFATGVALARRLWETPALADAGRLRAGYVLGSALAAQGLHTEAATVLQPAVALADAGQDPVFGARLRAALADACCSTRRFDEAGTHLQAALALAGPGTEPTTRCQVLNTQAAWMIDTGRLSEAMQALGEALAVAESAADLRWQGRLLGNVGVLHYAEQRVTEARDAFQRSLAFSEACGDRRHTGDVQCNLGLALHDLGEHAGALRALSQALAIAREIGQRRMEAVSHCNLGIVHATLGDDLRARFDMAAALDIAESLGDKALAAEVRGLLAPVLERLSLPG